MGDICDFKNSHLSLVRVKSSNFHLLTFPERTKNSVYKI